MHDQELHDDKNIVELVGSVMRENEEGISKLAQEEVAQQRREESFWSKKVRKVKRELGLRKSGAKKINL